VSLQNLTVKKKHGMFPRSFGNEETLNFQRLTTFAFSCVLQSMCVHTIDFVSANKQIN